MTSECIMMPNCNTLAGVNDEQVNKDKSHKYANDLSLLSYSDLSLVSLRMVVMMEVVIFRRTCDAFDIFKSMVVTMTVGCARDYVTHTTRSGPPKIF